MARTWGDQALVAFARATSWLAPWHKLPFLLAMPTLAGLRVILRERNLFSTETNSSTLNPPRVNDLRSRTADGSYNSPDVPWMGMAGARFARNVPLKETFGEDADRALYEPNPRRISNELLARRDFIPVPYLNVLVSAWLQFMVHDWLSHGVNDPENPHKVPIDSGDDWPQKPMSILRTTRAPTTPSDVGSPAAFTNVVTHWWDGSQIYGSSLERQKRIRSDPQTGDLLPDGKIGLTSEGRLPIEPLRDEMSDVEGAKFRDLEITGVNGNWWIGLSILHTLFAREHNAVVDRLKIDFPMAEGEWLFQKARLTVAALIAKIHTTEWTPSLMNSPEGRFAMRGNWWGIAGEHYWRAYGRLSDSEEISGIPGSSGGQDSVPYAMTEEFTACYRMHPLMPDAFSMRRHQDNQDIDTFSLLQVAHGGAARVYDTVSFDDVLYSLATSNPGALVLHNYPNSLRKLPEKPDEGIYTDLAATDILRDRERGVPRYCQFRRLVGMPAPKTFEELTTNLEWRKEVRAIYATVEDVDLLVGTLCEAQADPGTPPGFGFSDTVFRIFILMASRRLRSDRFFTTDFTPEIYTPAGFQWIADNSMRTVLQRHAPSLAPRFADVRNVFFPWSLGAR